MQSLSRLTDEEKDRKNNLSIFLIIHENCVWYDRFDDKQETKKIIDNIEAQSRSLLKNGWKRVREKYEGLISLEKSLSKN